MTPFVRNTIKLIVIVVVYGAILRSASLILEHYYESVRDVILWVILVEQTTIPFLYGFLVINYLEFKHRFSPILLGVLPWVIALYSLVMKLFVVSPEVENVPSWMYITVLVIQTIFLITGAFIGKSVIGKKFQRVSTLE